jgi:hypothetical protein
MRYGSGIRFLVAAAAAAAAVVLVVVIPDGARPDPVQPRAFQTELPSLLAALRECDPELRLKAVRSAYEDLRKNSPDKVWQEGTLDLGMMRGLSDSDAWRVWTYLNAGKQRFSARDLEQALRLSLRDDLWSEVFVAYARVAGSEARRRIDEFATQREIPPQVHAEALIVSAAPQSAMRAFDLYIQSGMGASLAYERVARSRGSDVDAFLARSALVGDNDPALWRLISERNACLAYIKDQYQGAPYVERLRILEILGSCGDRAAVQLLRRALLRGSEVAPAARALCRVAHAGSDEAILGLVAALPPVEDMDALMGDGLARTLMPALQELPARAGAVLLQRLKVERSTVERRRIWIAVGSLRNAESLIAATQLAESSEERSLLLAHALSPFPENLDLVEAFVESDRRAVRQGAYRALLAQGSDDAIEPLKKAMERSSDRKDLVRQLLQSGGFVRPLLEDGLRHRDVSAMCRRRLDELGAVDRTEKK